MTVEEAQAENRYAYVGGGPGAVVSGIVWTVAATVLASRGTVPAFMALFIGGTFIFPLGSLIEKYVFSRPAKTNGNALTLLGLESTICMLGGFFAAWLIVPIIPEYAFPLAAIAVGTHYLPFKTLYGDRTYWLLGALITIIGVAAIIYGTPGTLAMMISVAVIEIGFGAYLTQAEMRKQGGNPTA
jgi:hypothetical protein